MYVILSTVSATFSFLAALSLHFRDCTITVRYYWLKIHARKGSLPVGSKARSLCSRASHYYIDLISPVELFHQFLLESGPVFDTRKPEAPRLFDKLLERRIEGERG